MKKKKVAFTKTQENTNTKAFFSSFLLNETMGNGGVRTDTMEGLNMPSLQLFSLR